MPSRFCPEHHIRMKHVCNETDKDANKKKYIRWQIWSCDACRMNWIFDKLSVTWSLIPKNMSIESGMKLYKQHMTEEKPHDFSHLLTDTFMVDDCTCSVCGKTIDRKKKYTVINRNIEKFSDGVIDVLESNEIFLLCSIRCYDKLHEYFLKFFKQH